MLTNCLQCDAPFALSWWQRVRQRLGGARDPAGSGGRPARASITVSALGHDCIYSYARCRSCGYYSMDSYWDTWDDREPLQQFGPYPPEVGDRCIDLIAACPHPADPECPCASHEALHTGVPGP